MPRFVHLLFYPLLLMPHLSGTTHGDEHKLAQEFQGLQWLVGSWKHDESNSRATHASRQCSIKRFTAKMIEEDQAIEVTYLFRYDQNKGWSYREVICWNAAEKRLTSEWSAKQIPGRNESSGKYTLKKVSKNQWAGMGDYAYKFGRKDMKTKFTVTRESDDAFEFARPSLDGKRDYDLEFKLVRLPTPEEAN